MNIKNPNGTVPSASDGPDFNITESNAILQYAADLNGSIYYPKDLKARANVNRWLLWEASVWFPSCYVYLVEYVVKPLLKSEPDQSIIDAQAPKWNQVGTLNSDGLEYPSRTGGSRLSLSSIWPTFPRNLALHGSIVTLTSSSSPRFSMRSLLRPNTLSGMR